MTDEDLHRAQLTLNWAVSQVSPEPLILYQKQYDYLKSLGLDMKGCVVNKPIQTRWY